MHHHPPHPACSLDEAASHTLTWRVFRAFHRAMHAHRHLMARAMSEQGTSPAQAFCLRELTRNDGITQRDLAELLNVARPTVTVMLQKMEKAGLVERRVDDADQRYTRIYLTAEGRRAHDEMHGLITEVIDEALAPMSEADQVAFERLLLTMGDNMNAALGRTAADGHGSADITSPEGTVAE